MADHLHEVEITINGVMVHRHGLVFVGVPGDVSVRHRSQPVGVGRIEGNELEQHPGEWDDYDPEEWGWEEDTIPRD